jgi:hypothetical protein
MEPVVGFEPTTDGLQNRCSTTELNWQTIIKNNNLHFICNPNRFRSVSSGTYFGRAKVAGKLIRRLFGNPYSES